MQPGEDASSITNELENLPLIATVTDVNQHEHITNVVSHILHKTVNFFPHDRY